MIVRMLNASEGMTDSLWEDHKGRACSQQRRECGIHVLANTIARMNSQKIPSSIDGDLTRYPSY